MLNLTALQNFIARGGTPKGLLEQTVLMNPLMNNLINMAKNGNINNIEQFARNVFKEQGRDFDKEFSEFKQNFK